MLPPCGRVAVVLVLGLSICGCRSIAVVGKWLVGDPVVKAPFSEDTGTSLEDDGVRVALICTAPDSVLSDYDSVAIDLQEELERLMTRRDIEMVNGDDVIDVLNRQGGQFDARLIAEEMDADYILHVDIEYFDHRVPNSSQLYHGTAGGNVRGYKVVRDEESSLGVHATQIFEREFRSEYPGKHPIPAERVPDRVFRNRFIDSLSAELGRMFYDFRTYEAF